MDGDVWQITTLADIVRVQALCNASAPALAFGSRQWTYAQLDEMSGRCAGALAAKGIQRGDRVAILARNSDAFFEVLLACAKVGALLLPLNWRLAAPELAYILKDAGPKLVLADADFLPLLDTALQTAGLSPDVIMVGTPQAGRPAYSAWRKNFAVQPPVAAGPEDAILLLYTSGTTGHPKGAVIPHRALVEMRRLEAAEGPDWLHWTPADLCLISMPLFHIAGIRTAIAGLYNGSRLRVLSEFDAGEVLRRIAEGGVTKLFLVPAAMQALARHPDRRQVDFSGLRYMIYGGSPIALPILAECVEAFGCGFVQAYGSTETAGGVLTLGPDDHDPANPWRMGSAGRPVPGVAVKVVRADGTAAAVGEIGEVVVHGPCNMTGYWGQPEATRAVLDAEGWLRMGDLGLLDPDGYAHLRDRLKDMIITGGENVYPIEVESALGGHPAVAEVAVVGVPSERWGEEVRAVVVARPGATVTAEELMAWARARIAAYKTPKAIAFAEALPRNAAGKVLKRELRAEMFSG
jgi:acyl-CoA synthetase (AMP-forming)/AMP-acid ligase II